MRNRCAACDADLSGLESADGPAVFIVLIVGAVVVGAALLVEVKYQPPYWVHAVLWLPLILTLSLGLLRPFKAIMVALHYKYKTGNPA